MIALPTSASVYGALYEVGNLTAASGNGSNTEAVLTYVAGEDGFIAITTNHDGETEWWSSNKYATSWTRSSVNPLDDYDCTQPGRHGIHTYQDGVYFGADCAAGAQVFKVTGLNSVQLEHTLVTDNSIANNYPTAAEVGSNLYFFYQGGYTEFDGINWQDVEDASNQPNDAPLEASRQVDGVVYLSFNGTVASFDGTSYEIVGDEYLEGITENDNNNLPSIEYFNDQLYVGNQDFDNGATLFKRDPADSAADISNWDVVADLNSSNQIINKMLLSSTFGDDQYLVYFTSNHNDGVNVTAMDQDETMTDLLDAGLGGTDPENNSEVISAIRRSVIDRGTRKDVMLFSTQNTNDQTKIYILVIGKRFAFTPFSRFRSPSTEGLMDTTQAGKRYRVVVPATKVKAGDKYTLYVEGEAVDTVTAHSKRALTLRYKQAQQLSAGDTFTVQVGRKMSYGKDDAQILSSNEVMGAEVTVTVE
jgi:hypothetical protein